MEGKGQISRHQQSDQSLIIAGFRYSWSNHFSSIVADETKIQTFANSAKQWIDDFELDGIDIDFEYPVVQNGATPGQDTGEPA